MSRISPTDRSAVVDALMARCRSVAEEMIRMYPFDWQARQGKVEGRRNRDLDEFPFFLFCLRRVVPSLAQDNTDALDRLYRLFFYDMLSVECPDMSVYVKAEDKLRRSLNSYRSVRETEELYHAMDVLPRRDEEEDVQPARRRTSGGRIRK